eukprot:2104172-Rhodomonas_salina.1
MYSFPNGPSPWSACPASSSEDLSAPPTVPKTSFASSPLNPSLRSVKSLPSPGGASGHRLAPGLPHTSSLSLGI